MFRRWQPPTVFHCSRFRPERPIISRWIPVTHRVTKPPPPITRLPPSRVAFLTRPRPSRSKTYRPQVLARHQPFFHGLHLPILITPKLLPMTFVTALLLSPVRT